MIQRAKGTRDFLPVDMIKRRYVIETIRKVFESYGYDEMETPAFERWEVLTAKCGDEVKNQIFSFKDKAGRLLGLRFDLTIGLARVVASNPSLIKPFKRYCISRVWRYEEPQSGRFREFWQADVDVVGVKSMEADAEVIAVAASCLDALNLSGYVIKVNNRKILEGLALALKVPIDKMLDTFRAIDKMGKIGVEGVRLELEKLGLSGQTIEQLLKNVSVKGSALEVLEELKRTLADQSRGLEGIEEVEEIIDKEEDYGFADRIVVDVSLARGLDYYTGPIFEIEVTNARIGSVSGGGRYDELVKLLGGPPTPATGISLGIDRLVEVLEAQGKISSPGTATKVFIAITNPSLSANAIALAKELRRQGIPTEIDLMSRRLERQLKYADSKGIPYVVVLGPREVEAKVCKLRDMVKREEKECRIEELPHILKNAGTV
ncbi:MAG: histidine--tRNA ligase [Candidatus Nezhaarchaeales archaeon]